MLRRWWWLGRCVCRFGNLCEGEGWEECRCEGSGSVKARRGVFFCKKYYVVRTVYEIIIDVWIGGGIPGGISCLECRSTYVAIIPYFNHLFPRAWISVLMTRRRELGCDISGDAIESLPYDIRALFETLPLSGTQYESSTS